MPKFIGNELEDITEEDLIPEEWDSDPSYYVEFQGNDNCAIDPAIHDGIQYLSDAQKICKDLEIRAILYNSASQLEEGSIDCYGEYTLT